MNNKTLVSAIIALIIILGVLFFCFWLGKKGWDYLRGNNTTTVNQPTNNPNAPTNLPTSPEQAAQIYLGLGNPSNASTSDPNNYLLTNNFMVICYNRDKGIPNWVAWRISNADLGSLDREDAFRPDDRLPKGWTRITPTDYTGSGYDRGHVCPNADRYSSREAADSTFVMTNMTPQTGDLNRGPWQELEAYLRNQVKRGNDVYIYAGIYGEKGKIKKKVSIPTNDWKVAVVVPAGTPVSAINEKARVIAVDMPNVNGIKAASWKTYITTVRAIEKATGYNLLSSLPQNVQDALETKPDAGNN